MQGHEVREQAQKREDSQEPLQEEADQRQEVQEEGEEAVGGQVLEAGAYDSREDPNQSLRECDSCGRGDERPYGPCSHAVDADATVDAYAVDANAAGDAHVAVDAYVADANVAGDANAELDGYVEPDGRHAEQLDGHAEQQHDEQGWYDVKLRWM